MKTILKTTSLFFFAIASMTVFFSIFTKVVPDLQVLANVEKWKSEVRVFKIYQERRNNSKWKEYKIDKELKGPEIGGNDWSYPAMTVKHFGGFENIAGDSVSAQDTIHIIHNAKCFSLLEKEGRVFSDTLSEMNFCKYKVKDDRLVLRLYEESISNAEEVTIDIKDRKFIIDYETSYVFPYKSISWEIKEKSLTLNQILPVKIGSVLKGELEVEIDETIIFRWDKPSTKRTKIIKGEFQIKVEKNHPHYF